ncbi:hypothetical protein [Actinoplanes derwentensis]|uniref:hypothetical protein n=1 Tax=Actinoplanes derwentensis TaxID=113562 RepID=UPI0012FD52BC|nr:hypothetical protein [Actinoplanes derwentensis]
MNRRSGRGPGRPAQVDTAEIAAAVLAVGFRDLTFTAVAAHLRIGQATLYRHAANRDEPVRLGLDLAVSRVTWPSLAGPWRQVLEQWALAAWHTYARYPGATAEMNRGVVPHAVLLLADQLGVMLIGHGFRPADAVLAVDLVFGLAVDNRRGVDDLSLAIRADPIDWFRGRLRVVLAGVDRELAPKASSPLVPEKEGTSRETTDPSAASRLGLSGPDDTEPDHRPAGPAGAPPVP